MQDIWLNFCGYSSTVHKQGAKIFRMYCVDAPCLIFVEGRRPLAKVGQRKSMCKESNPLWCPKALVYACTAAFSCFLFSVLFLIEENRVEWRMQQGAKEKKMWVGWRADVQPIRASIDFLVEEDVLLLCSSCALTKQEASCFCVISYVSSPQHFVHLLSFWTMLLAKHPAYENNDSLG